MKVNKKNPKHWLYMSASGINVVVASALKNLLRFKPEKQIVFYGHTFNGNLRALADYVKSRQEFDIYFATPDPEYYQTVKNDPSMPGKPLSILSLKDTLKIARSVAVIADRRTNILEIMNKYTSIPFIDVWHGVAYKGFSPEDFRYIDKYEEIWVSSPTLKGIYEKKYEVDKSKLFATGYARVDGLINGVYDVELIKAKYDIAGYKKIVLVAPTWQQDDKGRDIIPFGVTRDKFFGAMNAIGRETNTLFIFRAHLNVQGADKISSMDFVRNMPYALYPDIEEFLAISDIVVSDWSSLVFDYLVLERPTIFLDVPPPFKSGFSLGPEYRFGEIVDSLDKYVSSIEKYLKSPSTFNKKYATEIKKAKKGAYGSTLDGGVSERQYKRLKALILEHI